MADFVVTDKTLESNIDRSADSFLIYDNSAAKLVRTNVNGALDVTSHPVGVDDVQTLTNKVLDTPSVSSPVLSGTITGTYTLGGTPTFPSSVVTLTGSQVLTNKTLTSPSITNATIANPTLTVDTISEYTPGAGVTIDGLVLKDSNITVDTLTADTLFIDMVSGKTDTDTGTVYGIAIKDGRFKNTDGWIDPDETWLYVSASDPIGVIKVAADVTTKYTPGMRISFVNGGNTVYGKIQIVGAYTGGFTNISFLHEINPGTNAALHLMANSAITSNKYAHSGTPYGFPSSCGAWTLIFADTTPRSQPNPTQNTWYNVTSISVPLGKWCATKIDQLYVTAATAISIGIMSTLSTTNNGATNPMSTGYVSGKALEIGAPAPSKFTLDLTATTTLYKNLRTIQSSVTSLYMPNDAAQSTITLENAYL